MCSILTDDTTWCGSGSVPWRALALGAAAGALALLSAAALHRRCTPRLLLAARHVRARAQPTARRARGQYTIVEEKIQLVIWLLLFCSLSVKVI